MPFVLSYLLADVWRRGELAKSAAVISQVYSYGLNVARQTAVLSDWYASARRNGTRPMKVLMAAPRYRDR